MYTYKNKTDQPLSLPGIGSVEPNGTIETTQKIESPKFELVGGEDAAPTSVISEAPQAPAPLSVVSTDTPTNQEQN